MAATDYEVGDEVYLIDAMFDGIVHRGEIVENNYTDTVEVHLEEQDRTITCLEAQVIHVDADNDEVEETIDFDG